MKRLLAVAWISAAYLAANSCAHSSAEAASAAKPMAEVKPAPGQSVVVVYRNVTGFMNAGAGMVNVTLLVDGSPVGDLSHDTYGMVDLAPGRHLLTAKNGIGESNLVVNTTADGVAFVQMETSPAPKMMSRSAETARVEIATDCSFAFRESVGTPAQAAAPAGNHQT